MASLGLVVGSTSITAGSADAIVRDKLKADGHTVEPKAAADNDLTAWAEGKGAVVVTASALGTDYGPKLKTANVAVVVFAAGGGGGNRYSVMGMGGTLTSSTNNIWNITTAAAGTAVVAGLSGSQSVWSDAAARSYWLTDPVTGSDKFAYVGADASRNAYFRVPAGTALIGGGTAPKKRIGLSGDAAAIETYSASPAKWRDLLSAAVADVVPVETVVPPSPSVLIDPVPTFAINTSQAVTATVDLNGGSAITTVAWSGSAGLTVTDGTANDLAASVQSAAAGDYTLTVTVTNADGKTGTHSRTVSASSYATPTTVARYSWNGSAFVKLDTRLVYLGDGVWLNLETRLTGGIVTTTVEETV